MTLCHMKMKSNKDSQKKIAFKDYPKVLDNAFHNTSSNEEFLLKLYNYSKFCKVSVELGEYELIRIQELSGIKSLREQYNDSGIPIERFRYILSNAGIDKILQSPNVVPLNKLSIWSIVLKIAPFIVFLGLLKLFGVLNAVGIP